jgi:DDE superfamily endonuclease.
MLQWVVAAFQREMEHYMVISEQRRCLSRHWFSREVLRTCEKKSLPSMHWRTFSIWMKWQSYVMCNQREHQRERKRNTGEWKGIKTMTILICAVLMPVKNCPLIVRKFEKPHCLKVLRRYPCGYKSCKTTRITVRLFSDCLFWEEMACQKGIVLLLMDRCAADNDEWVSVKRTSVVHTAKCDQLHAGVVLWWWWWEE